MNKLFIGRLLGSILALLIASGFSHTYAQIKKLGFWVSRPSDIERRKRDWVVNYVVIRSIHLKPVLVQFEYE